MKYSTKVCKPTLCSHTVPGCWICEHHQRHWLDQWKTWRKSDYRANRDRQRKKPSNQNKGTTEHSVPTSKHKIMKKWKNKSTISWEHSSKCWLHAPIMYYVPNMNLQRICSQKCQKLLVMFEIQALCCFTFTSTIYNILNDVQNKDLQYSGKLTCKHKCLIKWSTPRSATYTLSKRHPLCK